jgi:hypothetical protein
MQAMALIDDIRDKFDLSEFEFTKHAVDRAILRHVRVVEIREAIAGGEVIEDYPDDKYGPSCLILGFTGGGRPLHVQIGYSPLPLLKVITVYEPEPDEWLDFRTRR